MENHEYLGALKRIRKERRTTLYLTLYEFIMACLVMLAILLLAQFIVGLD